ncbi:MAG: transporter substrate-binding domain-containing protein [Rhodoferax sp.]
MRALPYRALVFAVFLLAYTAPNFAQTLRIETIEVTPFGFTDSDGKPTGMMFEIGNRIAEEAGLKYTNHIVPYARTVADLEGGTADLVLRYSNEKLTRVAIQVVSVVTMPTIIVGPAGVSYPSLDALHGKTVGMVSGGRFDDKFDSDVDIKKYEVHDYVPILKMLVAQRIDGAIGSSVGIYYSAMRAGIAKGQLGTPLILSNKDFVLHQSKKTADPTTMRALKTAVERLNRQGEIRKIVNKYMGEYPWESAGASK